MLRLRLKYMIKEMIGDCKRRERVGGEKRVSGVWSLHLTNEDGDILTRTSARIRVMVRTAINMPKRDAKQQNKRA